MKNKLLSLICTGVMFVSTFAGCGSVVSSMPYDADATDNTATDILTELPKTDKKFWKVCYSTPPQAGVGQSPYGLQGDFNTYENWKNIKDCGFNYAFPTDDAGHADIINSLSSAQEVGIKVIIMDRENIGIPSIISRSEGKSYDYVMSLIKQNEESLLERYRGYTQYSSFAGICSMDEPAASFFNAIAAGQDWWREHFPGYTYYTNLLPSYATYGQIFGGNSQDGYLYKDYVDMFINATNPDYISFDHYALIRQGMSGVVRETWLSDMEIYAEASKKYDIPFYAYILNTEHWNYYKVENYRELAWQVYSAMTFGCRGVQTFKYWSYFIPDNNPNNLGTGYTDVFGNRTPVWYAAQILYNEIDSFEDLFMSFDWQGVKYFGRMGGDEMLSNSLEYLYGVKEASSTGEALIGEFKNESGTHAYMVMNYNAPFSDSPNTVVMKFNDVEKVVVCKKGRKVLYNISDSTLTLEIGTGEAYFVIPVK